jgi:predicted SnoaL-like aldol condensation-catalyzing enzyme
MKMKYLGLGFGFSLLLLLFTNAGSAQVPFAATADQKTMLLSQNQKLASNKRLAYDFWREVLEAGHMDLAPKYMTETYIQHNPNVPTGRQGFIDFFSKFRKPQPITDSVKAPLIAIVAEADLVVLVFKIELPDPKYVSKKYATTGFDMFRIEGDKVAEH